MALQWWQYVRITGRMQHGHHFLLTASEHEIAIICSTSGLEHHLVQEFLFLYTLGHMTDASTTCSLMPWAPCRKEILYSEVHLFILVCLA